MRINQRRTSWLINTCFLGLLPAIARLVVWKMSNDHIDMLSTSDFVAFGLVLHSANISEVSRVSDSDESWKTLHNGLSIVFIVVYTLIMFTTINPSVHFNKNSALEVSLWLSGVSFLLSFAIFFRSQAVQIGSES